MMDEKLTTPCGLQCKICDYYGKACRGCRHAKGRPFWVTAMNPPLCPIYNCCSNNMKLAHCGSCAQLPCTTFADLRNPSLGDEEFQHAWEHRRQKDKSHRDLRKNALKNEPNTDNEEHKL